MLDEVWKDIKGYEGLYRISDHGRVLGLERFNSEGKRIKKERFLVPSQDKITPQIIAVSLVQCGGELKTKNLIQMMIEHFEVDDPLSKIFFKDKNIKNWKLSNIGFVAKEDGGEEGEIWKPLAGAEDSYEISNKGRLWRLPYYDSMQRLQRAGFIEKQVDNGYARFHVKINGKNRFITAWKCLCKTFLNEEPVGVLFKDNDSSSTDLDNFIFVNRKIQSNLQKERKIEERIKPVPAKVHKNKVGGFLISSVRHKGFGYYANNTNTVNKLLGCYSGDINAHFRKPNPGEFYKKGFCIIRFYEFEDANLGECSCKTSQKVTEKKAVSL